MFIWLWVHKGGCLPACIQWGILCLEHRNRQRDWKRSPKASLCPRRDQLYTRVVKDVLTLLLRMLLAVRKTFHPIHYEQGTRFVPFFIYELFYVAKDCYFIPISHLFFDLSHPVLSGLLCRLCFPDLCCPWSLPKGSTSFPKCFAPNWPHYNSSSIPGLH